MSRPDPGCYLEPNQPEVRLTVGIVAEWGDYLDPDSRGPVESDMVATMSGTMPLKEQHPDVTLRGTTSTRLNRNLSRIR